MTDAAVGALYQQLRSMRKVAKATGLSHEGVRFKLKRLGAEIQPRGNYRQPAPPRAAKAPAPVRRPDAGPAGVASVKMLPNGSYRLSVVVGRRSLAIKHAKSPDLLAPISEELWRRLEAGEPRAQVVAELRDRYTRPYRAQHGACK